MPITVQLPYDEQLILARVAQGDEAAFRALYDHYRQKIYFLAIKFLQSDKDALDITQEVFIKLWLNREKLSTVDQFSSYLYTVVRNYVYNRLRTKSIEEIFLFEMPEKEDEESNTPLESLSLQELETELKTAVNDLPPQQKKVFQLARLHGLKQEQIAAEMGISKETVKRHMKEALKSIRAKLENGGISLSLILLIRILFL